GPAQALPYAVIVDWTPEFWNDEPSPLTAAPPPRAVCGQSTLTNGASAAAGSAELINPRPATEATATAAVRREMPASISPSFAVVFRNSRLQRSRPQRDPGPRFGHHAAGWATTRVRGAASSAALVSPS